MQAASVRQSKRPAGLAELPPGEVVAMIRSLASCRSLHQRMLTASLQFLEEALDWNMISNDLDVIPALDGEQVMENLYGIILA